MTPDDVDIPFHSSYHALHVPDASMTTNSIVHTVCY